MRIDLNLSSIDDATVRRATGTHGSVSGGQNSSDPYSVAADANAVRRLTQEAMNVPEVRREKVTQLRHAIQTGTYKVNTAALASKIYPAVKS